MKYIIMILVFNFNVFSLASASALDYYHYSQQYFNDCKCSNQHRIDAYISQNEKKKAKKLSKNGADIGIIKKNSTKAKNLKNKKKYELKKWGIKIKSYDRAILFVNFGDEK